MAKAFRLSEEQFREQASKRARWQRGSEIVNTDTPKGASVCGPHVASHGEPAYGVKAGSEAGCAAPGPVAVPHTRGGASMTTAASTKALAGGESPSSAGHSNPRAAPQMRLPLVGAAPERDVLRVVLIALRLHPLVAWVERMNSGKFKLPGGESGEQWVRFGFRGMSDITGQLKDGRRLEVECKSTHGRTAADRLADQMAFQERVRAAGGIAFFARGVDDVMRELGA